MADWNFGQAFAQTAGALQQQDMERAREPYNIAHLQSLARLQNAQAGEAEMRLESEREMSRIMSQMSATGGLQGSAGLSKLAEVAARAGNPTMSSNLALRASQMRTQEARQAADEARQQREQFQRESAVATRYAALLQGVRSQQDLDAVNQMFEQEHEGEQAPLRQYDPQHIRLMLQALQKVGEAKKEKLAELDQQRKEKDSAALRDLRRSQKAAADALAENRRNRQAGAAKVGGREIGAPDDKQRRAAEDILKREGVMKDLDVDAGRTAAFDLASIARGLQRQNPALDYAQALQRAFVEEKKRGAYLTAPPKKMLGFDVPGSGKRQYTPRGEPAVPAITSEADLMKQPKGARVTSGGKLYEITGPGKGRLVTSSSADEGDDDE